MEDNNQQQQRDQALNETLERAGAFEETVSTKGWKFIKAFYQNQIQQFANELLLSSEEPIGKFENHRQQIVGMRKLMAEIENDLSVLERYRKEKSGKKGA